MCVSACMCVCILVWETIINKCIFFQMCPYLEIDFILAGDRCHA